MTHVVGQHVEVVVLVEVQVVVHTLGAVKVEVVQAEKCAVNFHPKRKPRGRVVLFAVFHNKIARWNVARRNNLHVGIEVRRARWGKKATRKQHATGATKNYTQKTQRYLFHTILLLR